MMQIVSRDWQAVALRGVIALVLGCLIIAWPGLTVGVFLLLFGVFAFVDGFFSVFDALARARRRARWLPRMLMGLFGIGVGVVTFVWPDVTATVLVYIIAAWALAMGIFEIVAAIEFRREITGEWLLAVVGILSVLFGLILFVNPVAGALALATLIGIYFIILGVLLLILAFQLRGRAEAAP